MLRIGLSQKKKLPCIKLFNVALSIKNVWKYFTEGVNKNWKYIKQLDKDLFQIEYKDGEIMYVTTEYGMMTFYEWVLWKNDYNIPKIEHGLVLDVGAGIGETNLSINKNNGIKCFDNIEINKEIFPLLEKNTKNNGWNSNNINEPFRNDMLFMDEYDLIKIDIEGYESQLLDIDLKNVKSPIVLEAHGEFLKEKFLKLGFKITRECGYSKTFYDNCYIMNNFSWFKLD